jgi:hypothetical protein
MWREEMKALAITLALLLSGVACSSKIDEHSYYKAIRERIDNNLQRISRSYPGAKQPLQERIRLGASERSMCPNNSFCYRCGRPWCAAQGHDTQYTEGSACFPLCEECWLELTPKERLPFYRHLVDDWIQDAKLTRTSIEEYGIKWREIEYAVLDGN